MNLNATNGQELDITTSMSKHLNTSCRMLQLVTRGYGSTVCIAGRGERDGAPALEWDAAINVLGLRLW